MLNTLLSTTTAAAATGLPPQGRLFRLNDGPMAGRMIALFARSASVLAWSRSDPPYTTWLEPIDIVADAADEPFSATMDRDGNVYVVYTDAVGALRCFKLVNASGTWAKQTTVTVYTSGASVNRHPSILKDAYDRVWIAWTRDDGGVITLRVKNSVDDAQTFGGGEADAGTELSSAGPSAFGQLITRSTYIHCLFTLDGTSLRERRIELDNAIWSVTETLYTGTGLLSDFNAALASDSTLGILFAADSALFLREFDGAIWGSLQEAASGAFAAPTLLYLKTAPWAIALASIGDNQQQILATRRTDGIFGTPEPIVGGGGPFATVLCYRAGGTEPFADLTSEAADTTTGDVLHPESGALLAATGDAVYFGADDRFAFIRIVLDTPGAGGAVDWEYWNGAEWVAFSPESGDYHFDLATTAFRPFVDSTATPSDWHKTLVNGVQRYWLRAVVTTPYTPPPVGTQLTAAADITGISIRRH